MKRDKKNESKSEISSEKPSQKKSFPAFNTENFQPVWEAFIEHLKTGKNERPLALLLEQLSPVIEEKRIIIEFTTKSQKSLFDEHLIDLNTRLHQSFGEQISIERRINAAIELKQQVAITSEDQFREMAEKNPWLMEMKKRFGLDFN